jgi:GNAT superfamily N-acetyltransferase
MMIHPKYRGQGIGKIAAKAVVEYATSNGYKMLYLKTTFDNHAVKKIYGDLGFKSTKYNQMELIIN